MADESGLAAEAGTGYAGAVTLVGRWSVTLSWSSILSSTSGLRCLVAGSFTGQFNHAASSINQRHVWRRCQRALCDAIQAVHETATPLKRRAAVSAHDRGRGVVPSEKVHVGLIMKPCKVRAGACGGSGRAESIARRS